MPTRAGQLRHVTFCPSTKTTTRPKGLGPGEIDLNVTGMTHRAYANASAAVLTRRAPQKPPEDIDLLTLALTSRSKERWHAEQAQFTKSLAAAYGTAGAGVSPKKLNMQLEDENKNAETIRTEWTPKVRATVRAMQETMRLKQQAANNPRMLLPGQAAEAREKYNNRQENAVFRLQAVARGLSARRVAKNRLSNFRAQRAVNAAAQRAGLPIRIAENGELR